MVKVRNMKSNNGNSVANQFEIETDDATYLQSYDSVIIKQAHNEGRVKPCYLFKNRAFKQSIKL